MFVISDNEDTCIGMRLAGIEGVVANNREDFKNCLFDVLKDKEIAVLLVSNRFTKIADDLIADFKANHTLPILAEIPSADERGVGDKLSEYIREAIGINI